ncbi:TRAP transporter substrate-binding protein DctP [Chloroflexota bacterium]
MKKILITPLLVVLVAGFVFGGCAEPAPAPAPAPAPTPAPPAKPIELVFSTYNSEAMYRTQSMLQWEEKIEKATNGRVYFTNYFGGALIGALDALPELLQGTADIAEITSHREKGGFPIQLATANWFFGAKDLDTAVSVYFQAQEKFPEAAAEWSKVKRLMSHGTGPHHLHSLKPVRKLDDLKGMQVRIPGKTLLETFQKLGASPVSMPTADLYMSLEKGIIDCHIQPLEALMTFALAEVEPYTTMLGFYGTRAGAHCLNLDSFNRLPPDIQKIIEDSLPELQQDINDRTVAIDVEGSDFANKLGHEWIELSPEDLARFGEIAAVEARESATALDDQGLPGTEIFNFIRQSIEKG